MSRNSFKAWSQVAKIFSPVLSHEIPPLHKNLEKGLRVTILAGGFAQVVSDLAYMARGGRWSMLSFGLVMLLAHGLVSARVMQQIKQRRESALWPLVVLFYVITVVVFNLDISVERARNVSLLMGLPSCLALAAPVEPMRVLYLGVGISVVAVSLQWHMFGELTPGVALLGLSGIALGSLSALACQLQRLFWAQSYQRQRQAQIMDRLVSLGRRTHLLVQDIRRPLTEGLKRLQPAWQAQRQAGELLQRGASAQELASAGQALEEHIQAVEHQTQRLAQELQKIKAQTTLQHMGEAQRFSPAAVLQQAVQQERYQHASAIEVTQPRDLRGELRGDPKALALISELLLGALREQLPAEAIALQMFEGEGMFHLELRAQGMNAWWGSRGELFTSSAAQRPEGLGTCRDLVRGFLGGELQVIHVGGEVALRLQAPLARQSRAATLSPGRAWAPSQASSSP